MASEILFVGWRYALAAVVMLIPVCVLSQGLMSTMINSVLIVIIGACVYLAALYILREK